MTQTTMTKRVLIIDDEARVLAVLRDFFASFTHGYAYEITTASSAVDAFVILGRQSFDLVLLDVVMPGTGQGLDLLKRVRELGVKAPVLMMTGGWGGTAKEAEALIAGAVGYLHKPFDLRELDHLVTLALVEGNR